MKRMIAFLTATLVMYLASLPALAHPSLLGTTFDKTTRNNNTYVGTESMGWMLDESCHTNGQHFTYKCAAGMSIDLITLIGQGAQKWSNNNPFEIEYDSASNGTIMVSSALSDDTYAEFSWISKDSSGHLTSWKIWLNSSKLSTITSVIIAHEFGHVFGLCDLYSHNNINKLMYGYYDNEIPTTVTGPTSSDKWGAKVITGYHTSHSWEYVYSGNNKHHRRCTSCGGYKTQGCTPNANGYCTKCGHYVDISPNGNYDPIAALLPDPGDGRRYFPRH